MTTRIPRLNRGSKRWWRDFRLRSKGRYVIRDEESKACPCRLLIVKGFLGLRVIFLGTLFFFFFFFFFFPFREPRRYSASTATWPVTWRPLVKIGWLGSITLCPTYHHHFVCRSIDSRLSDLWVGGY